MQINWLNLVGAKSKSCYIGDVTLTSSSSHIQPMGGAQNHSRKTKNSAAHYAKILNKFPCVYVHIKTCDDETLWTLISVEKHYNYFPFRITVAKS